MSICVYTVLKKTGTNLLQQTTSAPRTVQTDWKIEDLEKAAILTGHSTQRSGPTCRCLAAPTSAAAKNLTVAPSWNRLSTSSDCHRDSRFARRPLARPGDRGDRGGGSGNGGRPRRRVVEHRSAAGGAGVVRGEPGVDAPDMESVRAAREHAHLFAVRELAEADGADVGGDRGRPVRAARAVDLDGDAPERALLDPAGPSGTTVLAGGRASRPPDEAARDRVENEREEEREQQSREDDDHVGVEAGVASSPRAAAQRVLRRRRAPRRHRPGRRAHVPGYRLHVHAHGRRDAPRALLGPAVGNPPSVPLKPRWATSAVTAPNLTWCDYAPEGQLRARKEGDIAATANCCF
jgi:hypothetical protein